MITLAQKLSNRELFRFRRITIFIVRSNKKLTQYIELSKVNRMYKDCIDTAYDSCDPEIIEKIYRFFYETSKNYFFVQHLMLFLS